MALVNLLNNVPVPGQSLGASRDLINANFVTIGTTFSQNHVPYLDGSGFGGMHTFVQMPVQTGTPNGGFLAGQDTLFSRTSSVTTRPELVFVRGTGAAVGSIPQTYEITTYSTGNNYTSTASTPSIIYNYTWTRLPSGLIMLFGTQSSLPSPSLSAGITINFPTTGSFPGFTTQCYYVNVSLMDNRGGSAVTNSVAVLTTASISRTSFTFSASTNWSVNNSVCTFFAVGI